MLDQAIKIAVEAHSGQKTANGEPYILHPLYVMSKMSTEDERIVAVLHDAVEDSGLNFEDLIVEGFELHIIQALRDLTHSNNEPYLSEYIERIAFNLLAINVKIEDLKHNMDVSRLGSWASEEIGHRFRNKIFEKYIPAYHRLLKAKKKFNE